MLLARLRSLREQIGRTGDPIFLAILPGSAGSAGAVVQEERVVSAAELPFEFRMNALRLNAVNVPALRAKYLANVRTIGTKRARMCSTTSRRKTRRAR